MNIFGLYVDTTSFNMGICITGTTVSVMLFITSMFEKVKGKKESFYMLSLTMSAILMFLFNALTYLGFSDYSIETIDRIFICGGAIFGLAVLFSSNMYTIHRLGNKLMAFKKLAGMLPIVYGLISFTFCVGMLPICDWFYYVDARLNITATKAYYIFNALELILSFLNIVLIIGCGKKLVRAEIYTWLVVFIFPVIAFALNQFGLINIINLSYEIALILFYIAIHSRDVIEKHIIESELIESNAKLMVSQIQPHFLYNSLNTIYYLIGQDADVARKAVNNFSDYLRGNVNSLKNNSPVPIEEELGHVKAYLELEQLRFEDKITVEIEDNASSFMIPPLTVQPLVENAIKHGLSVKKEGGHIAVLTYEDNRNYYVEVSDNGVGFVAGKLDDREGTSTHIGLFNVYSRLKNMSGGKLRVISEPGEGTQCIISIPKKQ